MIFLLRTALSGRSILAPSLFAARSRVGLGKETESDYRQAIPDSWLQSIADSWLQSIDDTVARDDWGWKLEYDLEKMTSDMIGNLA